MPSGSEMKRWHVAIQCHSGNRIRIVFYKIYIFCVPSGSEIKRRLAATQCHSGHQTRTLFLEIMYFYMSSFLLCLELSRWLVALQGHSENRCWVRG